MRLFISWSEGISRSVAEHLRQYFPYIIQDLRPFMSEHDLASGRRWTEQLSKELEQCNFGIICLTAENQNSPWILFEAGALTKHVEGRACCLLLGGLRPADVEGPLAQFQNRNFEKQDVIKLLSDINAQVERPLDRADLKSIFEKWWPELEARVKEALVPKEGDLAIPQRGQADILEELLLLVRGLHRRIDDTLRGDSAAAEASLRRSFESVLAKLTPGQVMLLGHFADPKGQGRSVDPKELQAYPQTDVDAVLKCGLISYPRQDGTLIVTHPLFSKLITNAIERG